MRASADPMGLDRMLRARRRELEAIVGSIRDEIAGGTSPAPLLLECARAFEEGVSAIGQALNAPPAEAAALVDVADAFVSVGSSLRRLHGLREGVR